MNLHAWADTASLFAPVPRASVANDPMGSLAHRVIFDVSFFL